MSSGRLSEMEACNGVDVKRVVFNEITKSAVQEAMQHPREIDMDLVERATGAPRAGLSRGIHSVAGAVAQAAGRPLGGSGAVGGAASDLRARTRDRQVQSRRNTGPSPRTSDNSAGNAACAPGAAARRKA